MTPIQTIHFVMLLLKNHLNTSRWTNNKLIQFMLCLVIRLSLKPPTSISESLVVRGPRSAKPLFFSCLNLPNCVSPPPNRANISDPYLIWPNVLSPKLKLTIRIKGWPSSAKIISYHLITIRPLPLTTSTPSPTMKFLALILICAIAFQVTFQDRCS